LLFAGGYPRDLEATPVRGFLDIFSLDLRFSKVDVFVSGEPESVGHLDLYLWVRREDFPSFDNSFFQKRFDLIGFIKIV
jgi:hypothetical protein